MISSASSTIMSLVVTIGVVSIILIFIYSGENSIPLVNADFHSQYNKNYFGLTATMDDVNNNSSLSSIKDMEVTLTKSFKNKTGFYKLQGKFENHGYDMDADIDLVKYYKEKWRDNITQICYVQKYIDCEFKN